MKKFWIRVLSSSEVGKDFIRHREFRKVLKMESMKRKWRVKSLKLCMEYDNLECFELCEGAFDEIRYDCDYGIYDCSKDIYITTIEGESKRYYVGETKESYEQLKYILNLSLKIIYKDIV